MARPGRCDVDADARADAGQLDDRQRVVDFGGVGIVDREGADVGARQVARQLWRLKGRKRHALGELFVQETTVMQEVGRLDGAALEEHLRRRQAGFGAGRLEGLGFRFVAVRCVEQGASVMAPISGGRRNSFSSPIQPSIASAC